MIEIKTSKGNIEAEGVFGANIRRDVKTYPALKFVFKRGVTDEQIDALLSGELTIEDMTHEGYNTLEEVSVVIGKITTAEEERDRFENELGIARAEQAEMKENVNIILPKLDDETALSVKGLFPTWEECVKLGSIISEVGYRFTYNNELYKCKNPNPTFQSDWVPGVGTESLYERIDETHAGTKEDPIPYSGNMVLENGKYYTQNGTTYRCTRDSINPVYNTLAELVGHYVELA